MSDRDATGPILKSFEIGNQTSSAKDGGSLATAAQTKTLPDKPGAFSLYADGRGLRHPPSAVGLTAGDAASELGPATDIDLLRIIGAAIPGAVLIIVLDLKVSICAAARAAPIIAGVRTPRFEAAVIRIDLVAAVLAIQAVAADASANDAAKDRAQSRSGTALGTARDGVSEQTAGKRAGNRTTGRVAGLLALAFAHIFAPVESRCAIGVIAVVIVAVAVILLALLLITIPIAVIAIVVVGIGIAAIGITVVPIRV